MQTIVDVRANIRYAHKYSILKIKCPGVRFVQTSAVGKQVISVGETTIRCKNS